jgi:hypothetical protein
MPHPRTPETSYAAWKRRVTFLLSLYGETWTYVEDPKNPHLNVEPGPREFYKVGDSPEMFVIGLMADGPPEASWDKMQPETPAEFFRLYQHAYLASQLDPHRPPDDEEIRTWEAYVQAVGKRAATRAYWAWMKTLPHEYTSDVDPYG